MKFQVTQRINTNASHEKVMSAIEQQLKINSDKVIRSGDSIQAEGIESTFGSANRRDLTDIVVSSADGGHLLVAETKYTPTIFFWIMAAAFTLTYVFWLLPIVFYLMHRRIVKDAIETCFRNVNNHLATSPGPNPTARTERELEYTDTIAHVQSHQPKPALPAVLGLTQSDPTPQSPPPVPNTVPEHVSSHNSRATAISTHIPDESELESGSMYRDAKRSLATGDKEVAVKTLRELIRRHPDTESAGLARRALAGGKNSR